MSLSWLIYSGASDPHLYKGLRDLWHCLLHQEDQRHQRRGLSSFPCQRVRCLCPPQPSFIKSVHFSSALFNFKPRFCRAVHLSSVHNTLCLPLAKVVNDTNRTTSFIPVFSSFFHYPLALTLSLSATHCIWLVQVGGVTEMHICSRWNRRLLIAVCWRHASVRAKQLDCTRGACSVAHRCRSLVSRPLLLPQFEHPADKWEVRSKGEKDLFLTLLQ